MLSPQSPVTHVPGIGPSTAARLKRLGLATIADLLHHVPTRYDDFSKTVAIKNLKVGEQVTLRAKVQLVSSRRSFRRKLQVTEVLFTDGTGTIKAVWFNQPYLKDSLRVGDEVYLSGHLTDSSYGLQLEHPTWEPVARGGVHTGRLVPIYPSTAQLTQTKLRSTISRLLPLCEQVTDYLPAEVLQQTKLPSLPTALEHLHQPKGWPDIAPARRRLGFDELFLMSLKLKLAHLPAAGTKAPAILLWSGLKQFVDTLPWRLTDDQRVAAWEIIKDLGNSEPMYRLLQGDVGSGKTIVAGLAALNAAAAGWQVVLIAPTEILADQHAATLSRLFTNLPHVTLGLLTASKQCVANQGVVVSDKSLKIKLKQGQVDILIGTHAVLQASVRFKQLGLIVVDEQHRFGVEQRQLLHRDQRAIPHFLSLSATPIPRSLALTLYGNLKLSTINHLPAGRKLITTRMVQPNERTRAYDFMRQEVARGHRVFIVCPTIEESDVLGVRAVTLEHERLSREVFPELTLGLLHGKLPARAKASAMKQFVDGHTPILVTTSVIEVGVDVPQATVIAIESAERFGLAQLHQFRGRVGRSNLQSYCLLLTESTDPKSLARLDALVRHHSGFDLAEFDLKQRGPGDIVGELQSGWSSLRFASLADQGLLKTVQQATDLVLKQDSTLKPWPELKNRIAKLAFHPE